MKNLIINASVEGNGFTLRGADNTEAKLDSQNRVALTLIGSDEAKLRQVFDRLAGGGQVHTALEKMFWGDTFGTVTDKYGISWRVNIEAPKA